MATYKIGKLKLNLSKAGFAFRWGDGEIRRFPFGFKSTQGEDVADGLDQYDEAYYDDASEDGYDYADEDGAGDDYASYDDGAYDEGDYADADAGAGDYADYDYDDGAYDQDYDQGDYADDGYDQGDYADDGYDQGAYDEGDYADDEYADDGYDQGDYADEGYYDEDGNYIEGGAEADGASSLMQYIDENDWVTYALLVLLPPLGIYLLWRRGRFDNMLRIGISVASALWFAVLIYLIVSLVSGGMWDRGQPAEGIVLISPSPSPTATVAPSVQPSQSAGVLPSTSPLVDETIDGPTATPIAGDTQTGDTGTEYVYAPTTGLYYHNNPNCPVLGGATASTVTLEIAVRRNLNPCPTCYDTQVYYMTDGGRWYHTVPNCDGGTGTPMQGAEETTLERAQNAGKTACPKCAGGTDSSGRTSSSDTVTGQHMISYVNTLTTDRSGVMVYATQNGTYFHTVSNCDGGTGHAMSNASQITLLRALQEGKAACPVCCEVGRRLVYCTENGEWFHIESDCQGMRNAKQTYVAVAMAMGKTACPECMSGMTVTLNSTDGSSGGGSSGSSDSTVYVYATRGGEYYHTDSTCNGMRNAERVALSTMLSVGRPACPDCCPTANNIVYARSGGTYYHSYATCSGMSGATTGTVAQALAAGFQKCPRCWTSSSSSGESGTTESVSGITVYCTENGRWYHNDRTCQGMSGARAVTLEEAVSMGKTACETCCSQANRIVFAVSGGQYYHYDNTCRVEDLSRATSGTLARALMAGFARCPSCVGSSTSSDDEEESSTSSGRYVPGTSGIRVYANQNRRYYHLSSSCAGSGASYVTLETALNYGKEACPVCAKATTDRPVWSSASDPYFHIYQAHAGEGATSATLAHGHASGKEYCPVCLARYQSSSSSGSGTPSVSSGTYVDGTSGLYVYATREGEFFHIESTCPDALGEGASRVTLETALNYGKRPCTTCSNLARRVVYSTASDQYYHYSQTHAGSGSTSGYLAHARAVGKTACPVCVSGSSSGGGSGSGTSGSGDSGSGDLSTATQVYIDLQGDSDSTIFHSHSTCSRAGMTDGSMVNIQFVRDQGFSPCSYCW